MQKVLLLINLPQSTRSCVTGCDHWDKIKTISKINCGYYPTTHISPMFQVFRCKIEIVEEFKWPLLLSVANITLMLRFMKKKKKKIVQADKVVKSKGVSC